MPTEQDYAALIAEDAARDLQASVASAVDANPDAEARLQTLAKTYNLPVDAIRLDTPNVERRAKLDQFDYETLVKQTPATARLLSDPQKARIAHDDTENLSGIEKALYALGKFEVGTAKAIASAVPKFNEGLWGVARAGVETFVPNVLGRKALADQFAQWGGSARDRAARMMPKADGVLESSWYSGMQSLGLNALLLPASIASGGSMAPVLTGMGLSTGGGAYGEARDAGKSSGEALIYGGAQGGIEAATEMIGLPALFSILKPGSFLKKAGSYLVKEQGGEQIATHLQDLNEWAVLHPEKTIGDYLKERPDAAVQTALATAFGGGGQVALMKGVEVMARRGEVRAQQADQTVELLGRLNEMAAASKVLQRDAGTFEQLVDSVADNGPAPEAVFISAQTLQQSGIAEQLAQVSPAVAEQFQTALETGGDIRIPVGEYTARIAPSEFAQPLMEHLKFDAEGFSQAEAKVYMQEQAPALQAEVERVLGEDTADAQWKASAQEVEDAVFEQLQSAGRFTEQVSRTDAVLHKAFASVMGAKLGMTPAEFFKEHTLRVIAERVEGAQFDQGASLDALRGQLDTSGVSHSISEREGVITVSKTVVPKAQSVQDGNSAFEQGHRGSFNPASNTIALLKNADLSTFLHESGHFFLEVQSSVSNQLQQAATVHGLDTLKPGERQILDDTNALLKWFGISTLDEWNNLDFEEKRSYHEQFARGFEAYLFEGKAPSIELHGFFQRFRAWLLNVYKSLTALNVELTDEVRGVFDRMLATTEQIQLAEQGRSMMPLFESAEQAGWTPEEFADYQANGIDAANTAIEELQARGLRDMQWLHNARGRMIKKLQKQSAARRAEVRMEARREVMSQPIYRAWDFLTRKVTADDALEPVKPPKSSPDAIDETMDSLFVAIAKLGGLNKAEVIETWGTDPADKPTSGVFGKPVWRLEGGLSIDGMAEALAQYGYLLPAENGKVDLADFEQAFADELRGHPGYSNAYDPAQFEQGKSGESVVNPQALNAGRLDRSSLDSMDLPPEVVARLDALKMIRRDGIPPDFIAEKFGLSSGDELVRKLAAVENPKDAIDGLTDQRMLEQYGDLSSEQEIEKAADKAIHNEARARMAATEANALAKATGKPRILASAAREYAAAMIARLKVRAIHPGQYASAEVRSLKAAAKAMKAGDLETAAAESRNRLLNTYATKAAYEAQEEIEKALAYFKKVQQPGKIPEAHHAQIVALLSKFDLRVSTTQKAIDNAAKFRTWAKAQIDAGSVPPNVDKLLSPQQRNAYAKELQARNDEGELIYPNEEDQALLLAGFIDDIQVKSYKEATVEELLGLRDTIKQIEHIGRRTKQVLTDRKNREFAAVVESMRERIVAVAEKAGRKATDTLTPNDAAGKRKLSWRGFFFSHIKAANLLHIMDGGDGGPMMEHLMLTANEAGNGEVEDLAKAHDAVQALLQPVKALGDLTDKPKYFPSIDRSLNRQARIVMALNLGNESNVQRLLGGHGWTMEQIVPVLESLTATDWTFVQGMWDYYETFRPRVGAMEAKINGVEPEWVEARPFSVRTADGQTLNLRGGYAPVIYDPRASGKSASFAGEKDAKQMMQAARVASTVSKSFTKARVEEVNGRPLLLSLDAMIGGIQDTIHYLHWQPWIIDANRMIKALDGPMREYYGAEVVQQLRDWAGDNAAGMRPARDGAERAVTNLARNVSFAGLAFNVVSAAQQITGYTQSIVVIGSRWMARGLAHSLANPRQAYLGALEKSSFMRKRASTRMRDLAETRNTVQDQGLIRETLDKSGYSLMLAMQSVVDVPTWWGAYEKFIDAGHDEAKAVLMADQAVVDAQGGGLQKDMASIERATGAIRLLTGFMSFMNTTANVNYRVLKSDAGVASKAIDLVLVNALPVMLTILLKAALTPGDSGDDDAESLAKKYAREQVSFLFGQFVGFREIAQLGSAFSGEPSGDYGGAVGTRMAGDILKLAKQVGQGEADDALRKSLINTAGTMFRIPGAQINRSITGAEALADGETDNPAAIAFGFQKPR